MPFLPLLDGQPERSLQHPVDGGKVVAPVGLRLQGLELELGQLLRPQDAAETSQAGRQAKARRAY